MCGVTNGFSDLTKVKIGQDQWKKDITNECQEKALREGCHEREQAWMGVSSTEKTNTKEDLARAMTKSKSKMQTVTNGHVGQKGNDLCCWETSQCQRPGRVSRIAA